MSRIVILGAGVCGLAGGLMLSRDGHEVTIVERDPAPVPESPASAWEDWSRDGVSQFRQPHFLQPRGRAVLEQELPDVLDGLVAAGAARFSALRIMPPSITDREPRPGDERFATATARRPVLEQILGRVAESEPGLDVRRGVTVTGLETAPYDGLPHVTGVKTDRGERLDADLVIDAMGRRSATPAWVADVAGAAVHEESEDSGFLYYTRFFRASAGEMPQYRAPPLTPIGSFTLLILVSDDDTWSVTIVGSAGDRPLKRVRDPERWKAVVAACPAHAQWLDGEPLTDVLPMGGIVDRYRRLVVDGEPLVTGLVLLADSWACTNPSVGRGMALGLLHAGRLRDTVRSGIADPRAFALTWDEVTETHLTPWYRDTVNSDRIRLREMDALRNGTPPGQPASAVAAALPTAVTNDPDLFRAFVETRSCLSTLDEVLARPGIVDRILEVASAHEPQPMPGPDREQLVALLS